MTEVESPDAAAAWLQQFHIWYQTHRDFLKHRSYLSATTAADRPKTLRPGQTSWYTHKDTRSAYFALKRLVTNDHLFTWLTARTHEHELLPPATSRLEGGHNQPIKELLRAHRGMSESHAAVAISWLLYMRTENAEQPWKLVTPEHWATTRKLRIVSTPMIPAHPPSTISISAGKTATGSNKAGEVDHGDDTPQKSTRFGT